jgi:hypothetical protein
MLWCLVAITISCTPGRCCHRAAAFLPCDSSPLLLITPIDPPPPFPDAFLWLLLLHCFMGTLSTNSNLQQQASMCAWTEWDMPFDQLFMGESLIWFVPGRHQKHCMCSACGLLEDWQEEPHAQLTQITSNLSTAHATSADM